jgi:glycosyltransferase involved in cell wall biosynthesis
MRSGYRATAYDQLNTREQGETTPRISIIIPTFNRCDLLQRALASVFSQTYRDWELIVVDDGSTDGTDQHPGIVQERPEYRFTRLETNHGVAAARNHGVSLATGAWLAFLDSDDTWLPEKLARQVAWIDNHPHYRIVQTREIWVRDGVRVNPPRTHEKTGGDLFRQSLARCMITPSSVMLQQSLFAEYNGFNASLPACEDYDLWLRITAQWPVGLVDEYCMTRYGGHDDQLSATTPVLDRFRIRALLDLLASGRLTPQQIEWTRQTLAVKARIVANGYFKRHKEFDYEHYLHIARQFE